MNPNIVSLFSFPELNSKRVPLIIAGPCSVENSDQLEITVQLLVRQGITIIRGGVWKPRTRPDGFEGLGTLALPWITEMKKKYSIRFAVEVASANHVEESLKAEIDVLWIGARSTVNTFTVQEIAESLWGVDVPVLVKNPVYPDLSLWLGPLKDWKKLDLPD
jgi:chorismate mutase